MAAFGLDTTVTQLGHLSGPFSNTFDVDTDGESGSTDLETTGLLNQALNYQILKGIDYLKKRMVLQENKLNHLYSAIRDIRREQLRGKRNI